MQASLQFFGAGVADAGSRTVLLSIDGRRYMFNCSPGTQRCALQHGLKFARVEAVFLTSLKWSSYGGFKGMVSTLADIKTPPLHSSLPQPSQLFCCESHPFRTPGELPEPKEQTESSTESKSKLSLPVEDPTQETVKVIGPKGLVGIIESSYSFLKRSMHFLRMIELEPNEEDESTFSDGLIKVTPIYGSSHHLGKEEGKRVKRGDTFCGYLIEGPAISGKFDAKAAKAKGVPPGPLYRDLVQGKSITLPDSTIVTPEGIVSPPKQFPKILISETFANLPKDLDYGIGVFYCHGVNDGRNFFLGELAEEIDEAMSVVLKDSADLEAELAKESMFHHELCGFAHRGAIKPLDEIVIFPEFQVNTLLEPYEGVAKHSHPVPANSVITLGTGAAMPGKYRNVSCVLYLSDQISGIFDCGEASLAQLCRKFGSSTSAVLDRLDFIAISHMHSDHHLGLIDFVETFIRRGRTIKVYGPKEVFVFVNAYLLHNSITNSLVEFIENRVDALTVKTGFLLKPVPCDHCPNSYSFVLATSNEHNLVSYSGDTRPCPALVEAGRQSDILIHEATMPDDLAEEALHRKHCTFAEAIQVSLDLQAKFTILVHLSQRFGKTIPALNQPSVVVATDFMQVDFDDLNIESVLKDSLAREAVLNKLSDKDDE